MILTVAILASVAALGAAARQDGSPAFPPATAESVELSPGSLDALAGFVRELCERDELVGAELLVIKDGRTVLHEACGWNDREARVPMARGTLFNVRSMTKPVLGTLAQQLVEEGALELDAPVHRYLPAFDAERSRAITVRQLLEHRSGLEPSSLWERTPGEFAGLSELADWIGARGPSLPPGATFRYSDDGSSVLGAVVAAAGGASLEELFERRVLGPLGMRESLVRLEGHPLRERICTGYMGGRGNWVRQRGAAGFREDPYLLGSQGLYCTPRDYARFLSTWMHGGRFGGERLLRWSSVRRALRPASHLADTPVALPGLEAHYGQMWRLYVDPERSRLRRVVGFGHSGSDGTWALAWPELELMVLCFTQSRDSEGLGELEAKVFELLIAPGEVAPPPPTAAELAELSGYYWSPAAAMYRVLREVDGELMAELPRSGLVALLRLEPERYALGPGAGTVLDVERDASGAVTGFAIDAQGEAATWERIEPGAGLPGVGELLTRRGMARAVARLDELGPLRFVGRIERARPLLSAEVRVLATPDGRHRRELRTDEGPVVTCFDGRDAWARRPDAGALHLAGELAEQIALDHPAFPVLDWSALFEEIAPVTAARRRGREVLLLRATPREGVPWALAVDPRTGRLVSVFRCGIVPGAGRVGLVVDYEDWRDVGGLELPYRLRMGFASSLLGEAVLQFDEVAAGVELVPDAFELIPARQLVDVGGHRLQLETRGAGSPTVVIDVGLGDSAEAWELLVARLAETTRVCIYARAGYGESEPGPFPRTPERAAAELAGLLARAELEPPFVVVGHSYGGLVAQHLAAGHPRGVAALVLLDPPPRGFLAGERFPELRALADAATREFAAAAEASSEPSSAAFYRTLASEHGEMFADPRELELGDLLAVVVASGLPNPAFGELAAAYQRYWQDASRALAAEAPRGRFVAAPDSGHHLHLEAPELVAQTILDVVAAVRRGG